MTLIARFQVDSFEPRQVAGFEADWFGLMTYLLGDSTAEVEHLAHQQAWGTKPET